MNTSLVIAYMDAVVAPLLLMMVFSKDMMFIPVTVRFAVGLLATGMAAQAIIVLTGTNQLKGWGTLWALKDIGGLAIAVNWFFRVGYKV